MKSNDVMKFFREIKDDPNSTQSKAEILIKNMCDYLSQDNEVKQHVKIEKENGSFHFLIKPFGLAIFCNGSYKLYEIGPGVITNCYQLKFIHKQKDEEIPILTVYITGDGYIVSDINESGSICDVQNEQQGKRVFSMILNSLCDSKTICL